MKTIKTFLSLATVVVLCLLVTSEIEAQQTCTGGQYSVTFNGKTAGTPVNGQATLVWNYTIVASQTALSAVKSAVMIIPRPVKPGYVVSPAALTYCLPSDNNTKINTGNCDGFPVTQSTLTKVGPNLTFSITTFANVTQDVVSLNIVNGASSSVACVAALDSNGDPTGGISGPGALGDPFQPLSVTENVIAAGGKCQVTLNYDANGKLTSLSNPISLDTSVACTVANPNSVLVNGLPLQNNVGRSGITFGTGTTTCYGPPVPSTPWCVCTALPCP